MCIVWNNFFYSINIFGCSNWTSKKVSSTWLIRWPRRPQQILAFSFRSWRALYANCALIKRWTAMESWVKSFLLRRSIYARLLLSGGRCENLPQVTAQEGIAVEIVHFRYYWILLLISFLVKWMMVQELKPVALLVMYIFQNITVCSFFNLFIVNDQCVAIPFYLLLKNNIK